jgi:two-component system KDP operon response regulator KdpE
MIESMSVCESLPVPRLHQGPSSTEIRSVEPREPSGRQHVNVLDAIAAGAARVAGFLERQQVGLRRRLRFARTKVEHRFISGALAVDLRDQRAIVEGREIHLSPTERLMLMTLVNRAGQVVTYRVLLNQISAAPRPRQVAYLRALMACLCRKLEPDPRHPRFLSAEPGVGYRLSAGTIRG